MKKIIRSILLVLVSLLVIFSIYYLTSYYKAVDVDNYLTKTEEVNVEKTDYGYYFKNNNNQNTKIVIFYPGAKVDETAYSPILFMLCEKGIDCFIVKMPLHMAIFGVSFADKIIEKYDYEDYYICGHSMGGAMAGRYLEKTTNRFSGLILLSAYVDRNLTEKEIPCLSIYGSLDGVLSKEKEEKSSEYFVSYTRYIIEGGNHALFGSYGKQKGDNDALITHEMQWNETVNQIYDFINKHNSSS